MPTIPKSANREYLEDEVQAEEVDFLLLQEVHDELPPVLTCCGGGGGQEEASTPDARVVSVRGKERRTGSVTVLGAGRRRSGGRP